MSWEAVVEYFTRAAGAFATLAATLWKGDDVISSDARKWLAACIENGIEKPCSEDAKMLSDIVASYFSRELPALRFVRNVFVFTVASMLALMLAYVPLTPGFFSSLM